jgi:hypothetical protein
MKAALLLGVVAALCAVGAAPAAAKDPHDVTVMTQNIYQGTELEHVLAATTPLEAALGVATDYRNMVATNFPERADALAAEIARDRPALVGLQEVATWRTQFPYDPTTPPSAISYDFLQILLDALQAHGAPYHAVVVHDNWNAVAAGLFSLPSLALTGVRLTESSAIIARSDLGTDDLKLSNPQAGDYRAATVIPTLTGPFRVGGSWLSVDAKVHGKSFRFVTTHLDPVSNAVRAAQADEILQGPADTDLPVVLVGDLNSTTTTAAYAELTGAGLVDTWLAAHPGEPGLTCCQVPPDSIVNPISQLHERVDYVLAAAGATVEEEHLVGDTPAARTASGLWPSDHAGLVTTLKLGG